MLHLNANLIEYVGKRKSNIFFLANWNHYNFHNALQFTLAYDAIVSESHLFHLVNVFYHQHQIDKSNGSFPAIWFD